MPKEIWGGVGGSTYRDAFEEFANGRVVIYLSGSWQIRRMDTQIGKNFDWIAMPNPCGPAACTGIPGGAAFVALKRTKNPKDVGRFLDFLASEPVYAEYMARTENIPAHRRRCEEGRRLQDLAGREGRAQRLRRRGAEAVARGLRDPGLQVNRAIFNPTAARLGQADRRRDVARRRVEANQLGHRRTGQGGGK